MPSVWWVTNGNDSGSGSLRAAYQSAEAQGNGQEIIIDEDVETITLNSPLDVGAMNFTTLEITGEDPNDPPVISPNSNDFHEFRFLNHSGNNGVTIIFENLKFEKFGSPVITSGGFTTDYGDGGAVKTVAPLYLVNCNFFDNEAGRSGGAIYSEYLINMEDCSFTFNDAVNSGGAIYSQPASTGAGITINGCLFESNRALGGDGGAIYFYTADGTLGIYGDTTKFSMNDSDGQGGAIYQYGGAFEAISSGSASTTNSGFQYDTDDGSGNEIYLAELQDAHIDIVVNTMSGIAIYLHSFIPPPTNNYWSDINVSRVSGGTSAIDSNWPY